MLRVFLRVLRVLRSTSYFFTSSLASHAIESRLVRAETGRKTRCLLGAERGAYASRNTIIGSTRPAERAGKYDATTATMSTAAAVPPNTVASVGFTSFIIVFSKLVS